MYMEEGIPNKNVCHIHSMASVKCACIITVHNNDIVLYYIDGRKQIRKAKAAKTSKQGNAAVLESAGISEDSQW